MRPLKGSRNRRARFVAEYNLSHNATKAAQKAGYSERSAYSQGQRLLKNAEIIAAIEKAQEKRLKRLELDADYVLIGIQDTVERCRQSEPVVDRKGQQVMCETPDGELAPAYTFNALGALKGYELLGKHLKLFTEKIEQSSADGSIDEKIGKAVERLNAELAQKYGNMIPPITPEELQSRVQDYGDEAKG